MSELTLECTARSDIGRRKNNEDAVYASPRLAAVADGVGGAAAGEVASGWIIQALQHLDKSRLGGPLELAGCAEGRSGVGEAGRGGGDQQASENAGAKDRLGHRQGSVA